MVFAALVAALHIRVDRAVSANALELVVRRCVCLYGLFMRLCPCRSCGIWTASEAGSVGWNGNGMPGPFAWVVLSAP
jgi:hypothetical protein